MEKFLYDDKIKEMRAQNREALKKKRKYIREKLKEQGLDLDKYETKDRERKEILEFYMEYNKDVGNKELDKNQEKIEKLKKQMDYLTNNYFPEDFSKRNKECFMERYLKLIFYKKLMERNSSEPIFACNNMKILDLIEKIESLEKISTIERKGKFKEEVLKIEKIYDKEIDEFLKQYNYAESSIPKYNILLKNHQQIMSFFIDRLRSLSYDDCVQSIEKEEIKIEKKMSLIWSCALVDETYTLVKFTIDNIYSARLRLENSVKGGIKELKEFEDEMLKLNNYFDLLIEDLNKELYEKKLYDEWYYNLYFLLTLNIIIEEKKMQRLNLKSNEEVEKLKNKFKNQVVINKDNLEKIKYSRIGSKNKQPNNYKERLENIDILINSIEKNLKGIIFPKIDEIKIFLYYVIYLNKNYKYQKKNLMYWVKYFNKEKNKSEANYIGFLQEVNSIIKGEFFNILDKREEYSQISKIEDIIEKILKKLINIPSQGFRFIIILKILREIDRVQKKVLESRERREKKEYLEKIKRKIENGEKIEDSEIIQGTSIINSF